MYLLFQDPLSKECVFSLEKTSAKRFTWPISEAPLQGKELLLQNIRMAFPWSYKINGSSLLQGLPQQRITKTAERCRKRDSDTWLLQTSCPHIPAYYMQDTCSPLVQDLEERRLEESVIIKRRRDWSVPQTFCLINEWM